MGRIDKLFRALSRPAYWPALARGVVPGVEHDAAFEGRDVATVIDAGVNKGQFACFAQARWPHARLICFEPLPGPRRRLRSVTSGSATIHPLALGDTPGQARMHLASREDSSSLLAPGKRQAEVFGVTEAGAAEVRVDRLDAVLDAGDLARPVLLKIDVQGFEYELLKGAQGVLHAIDLVYVECSFEALYDGQKLAGEVAALLAEAGFAQSGRFNLDHDAQGALVQADLLFQRIS